MAREQEPVGLAAAETIDAIVRDPPDGWILLLLEVRGWGESAEQPDQLRRKLKAYRIFVSEGYLLEMFPESEGGEVTIVVQSATTPTPEIGHVLDAERRHLRDAGIGLKVEVLPQG
jgi:hypothetical protein